MLISSDRIDLPVSSVSELVTVVSKKAIEEYELKKGGFSAYKFLEALVMAVYAHQ